MHDDHFYHFIILTLLLNRHSRIVDLRKRGKRTSALETCVFACLGSTFSFANIKIRDNNLYVLCAHIIFNISKISI